MFILKNTFSSEQPELAIYGNVFFYFFLSDLHLRNEIQLIQYFLRFHGSPFQNSATITCIIPACLKFILFFSDSANNFVSISSRLKWSEVFKVCRCVKVMFFLSMYTHITAVSNPPSPPANPPPLLSNLYLPKSERVKWSLFSVHITPRHTSKRDSIVTSLKSRLLQPRLHCSCWHPDRCLWC